MTNAGHAPPRLLPLDPAGEPGVREYLGVLGRRRRAIVVFTLLVLVVALASSLVQTPRYTSEARVLIEPRVSEQELDQTGQPLVVDRKRIIDTEVRLLGSRSVRDQVERTFGPDTPAATTAAIEGTDLVSVSVSSTDAELAAAVANETARRYISFRTESTRQDLAEAAESVQRQLNDASGRLAVLDELVATATGSALVSAQADRAAAAEQVRTVRTRLDALRLKQTLTTGNATLVDRAEVPSDPVSPTPVRSAILALFAGGILAVVLAFVLEFFDDRIDSRSGLEQIAPHLPVLGMVPVLSGWEDRRTTHVAALEDRTSSASEAYRSLRTSLQFVSGLDGARTIQVTSATAGEGKTTTAVNLAVMFAMAGQRTILIDADLRRPRVHAFLGLPNGAGYTTAALNGRPLSKVSHRVLEEHPLIAVTSGPPTPYPAELLQSEASVKLLDACRRDADVVIVDSPPVVPVADAVALSAHVDAVLLVVSAERSTKRNVRRAVDQLGQVAANVCGVAITEVPASQLGEYGTYVYAPDAPRRGIERFFRPGTAS
ncbi:MAG TPA: polysaccharide biosynthesis tyrosine autokinase [Aquihabitans sp.]|jgi:non-specific protein-tyrosine kinase|nr:polysaccharide biosynthesis tyrosine autokinase [Aquihabitans sp.]